MSPALQHTDLQIIIHSFLFNSSLFSFTHSLFLLFQFHLHLYSPYTHIHSSIHPSLHPSDQTVCSFALSVPLSPSLSSSLRISSPFFSFTFTEFFGYTTFSSPFPPLQVRSPLLNFNTIPVWLMNK